MEPWLRSVVLVTEWLSITYFVIVNSLYGVLLLSALHQSIRQVNRNRNQRLWKVLSSEVAPRISMLVPAYNEETTILASVRSFLSISYPQLEVVVVSDGSTDKTLQLLVDAFDLSPVHAAHGHELESAPVRKVYRSATTPNLTVVDKENGGTKADALNAGVLFASGDLVCAVDADTLVEPDALARLVRPFTTDSEVAAVGGTIRVINSSTVEKGRVTARRVPRHPLAGIQVVEYLRAFLFGRLGWNQLGGNLILSGAFGMFRKSILVGVGGYSTNSIGEDMDLVVKIRDRQRDLEGPRRIEFIADPIAWTEVPETLDSLGRQRDRWHRGLAGVLWHHRHLVFNPRKGAMGLIVFPYYLLVELMSPVFEVVGVAVTIVGLALGILDIDHALILLIAAYGYSVVLSLVTLIIDELVHTRYVSMSDRFFLLIWIVFENFGYRQLTVYWRLRGLWKFLRGDNAWGNMVRRGFQTSA